MRKYEAIGSWEDYRNHSWSLRDHHYRFAVEHLPIDLLSIFGNSIIILLSFVGGGRKIEGHFKYFIANTAFLGLCFSLTDLAHTIYSEILHHNDWHMTTGAD